MKSLQPLRSHPLTMARLQLLDWTGELDWWTKFEVHRKHYDIMFHACADKARHCGQYSWAWRTLLNIVDTGRMATDGWSSRNPVCVSDTSPESSSVKVTTNASQEVTILLTCLQGIWTKATELLSTCKKYGSCPWLWFWSMTSLRKTSSPCSAMQSKWFQVWLGVCKLQIPWTPFLHSGGCSSKWSAIRVCKRSQTR